MESWKLLNMAIGRGQARTLARRLGRSEDLINKWRREPRSEDNPTSTGARNPIDVVDDIFDFMLIYSLPAAHVLADRYTIKLSSFIRKQRIKPMTQEIKRQRIADALRENAEAIAVLIEGADIRVVRKEWEEAKIAIEDIVRSLEFTDYSPELGKEVDY